MDVYCTTCGEPWDTYHLLEDAVYETGMDEDRIAYWLRLDSKDKLSGDFREAFKVGGWEFGRTLMNVRRCPACEPEEQPDPETLTLKDTIEELLGDDLDGIASEFSDRRL